MGRVEERSEARIFVGMQEIGSLDYEDPVACVAAFAVSYPVDLDEERPEGHRLVRVRDDRELGEWAERNFDQWEIR